MADSRELGGIGHLFYFTSLQLIIYADRTLLAGLLPSVKFAFNVGNTRGGFLGSAFMGGFMLLSPFVAIAKGRAVCPTIGLSLLIWMLAEVITCFADSYEVMLFARMLAGAGEAGFCALAPPLIDDTAPKADRSLFVAIYYSAVFAGMAIGFVASTPFTDWDQARFMFLGLALIMAPYCFYIMFFGHRFHVSSPGKQRRPNRDLSTSVSTLSVSTAGDAQTALMPARQHSIRSLVSVAPISSLSPICEVMRSGMFVTLVLGFAASQFVVGGFAFWASDYLEDDLGFSKDVTGVSMGLMTITTGVTASAAGGALLDRLTEIAKERWKCDEGVRGVVGCQLCMAISLLVVPAAMGAAWIRDGTAFLCCLGFTQIFTFLGAAPFIVATMDSVSMELRAMSMGLSTFGGHLLGDLFSPTLVGNVADATGSLRWGIVCLSVWSIWCPIMWTAAYFLSLSRLVPVQEETHDASGSLERDISSAAEAQFVH